MNTQVRALRVYAPRSLLAQSNPASELGNELKERLLVATEHVRNNATDWRTLTRALIEEVALEHQSVAWDGYGALPISLDAKFEAQRLVDLLPVWLSRPDVVPDPDGEIGLSWDFGPGRVFTVSVSSTGILSYAGLLGDGVKRHGVEWFRSDVPKTIIEAIEELHDRSSSAG
jgi:hypothetical protein